MPGSEPGTYTYTISTVVTQTQHVEGLPLGTRGGMIVRHTFPADGEYVFSGRLLKTVAEGLVGVEGHETPHHFVVTIDGKRVFSAPIGGKEDHEKATENKPVAREEFDKRMMSPRIKVTAGLHEVGFTFIERPTQEQNMWQPVLRSSQEAHNPSGLPRLRNGIIEGPYNANGVSLNESRQKLFVCTPKTAAQEALSARTRSSRRSRAVRSAGRWRRSTSTRRWPCTRRSGPRAATSTPAFAPAWREFSPVPRSCSDRKRSPAALASGTAHRVSELELASRLSFFLWSSIPDDELLNLAIAGKLRAPGVLESQVRRMIADDRADALMTRVHRPVAAAAQSRQGHAGRPAVPGLRRQRPSGDAQGDRAPLRQHRPRESIDADAARRRLHVRQRAPGTSLRHPAVSTARISAACR